MAFQKGKKNSAATYAATKTNKIIIYWKSDIIKRDQRPFKALATGSSLVNPVSFFSSLSSGQSPLARQLRLSESEANR
jgi:hypothetical protein